MRRAEASDRSRNNLIRLPQSVTHCQRRLAAKFKFTELIVSRLQGIINICIMRRPGGSKPPPYIIGCTGLESVGAGALDGPHNQ